MMTVSVQTLGCKLNQLESEAILEAFEKEGFRTVSNDVVANIGADLYIINTCTVTSKAEQKARRIIRKAYRDYPESCVIITGCYAELKPDELADLEEQGSFPDSHNRIFIAASGKKSGILDLPKYIAQTVVSPWELSSALKHWFQHDTEYSPEDRFRFQVNSFSVHSRAFLKIQDGCDNNCTFCAVRLARGKSVSLAPKEIVRRLRVLEEGGYGEAVLTGVNINQYHNEHTDFPLLLRKLLEETKHIALRISSIEPDLIRDDFLKIVTHPRIRPHFHLSVQSGSDPILKAMGRKYNAVQVLNAIEKLREAKDDPFVACDIISGFPGEDDAEFEKTYRLCREAAFSWIHAFPFSPRSGTAAFHLPYPVPERTAVKRVEQLILLAEENRKAYVNRQTGRRLEVIIENTAVESVHAVGISENYLRVLIPLAAHQEILKPKTAVQCSIISPYHSENSEDSRIEDSRIADSRIADSRIADSRIADSRIDVLAAFEKIIGT